MPTTAAKPAKALSPDRDELVLKHLSLVTAIATRVRESLPVHVELDDLVHAGIMGLLDAASKYKTDKDVAFAAYARHRIRGAILDSLRDLDWASRDIRRRQKQFERAIQSLTEKLNRKPTEIELAQAVGVSLSRWRRLIVELNNLKAAASLSIRHESEDVTEPEAPCAAEIHPDRLYARKELRARLGLAKSTLPVRYQKLIHLYYERDMTMKEIGSKLGVNESRVSQMHKAALAKMQTALISNGIHCGAIFQN